MTEVLNFSKMSHIHARLSLTRLQTIRSRSPCIHLTGRFCMQADSSRAKATVMDLAACSDFQYQNGNLSTSQYPSWPMTTISEPLNGQTRRMWIRRLVL